MASSPVNMEPMLRRSPNIKATLLKCNVFAGGASSIDYAVLNNQ